MCEFQCPFTAEYVVALHKKILTDAVQFPDMYTPPLSPNSSVRRFAFAS